MDAGVKAVSEATVSFDMKRLSMYVLHLSWTYLPKSCVHVNSRVLYYSEFSSRHDPHQLDSGVQKKRVSNLKHANFSRFAEAQPC